MPWTQKQMLRDANGDLIPQYWDVVEQEFKPLTGRDGANDVRLTGSIVEDDYVRVQSTGYRVTTEVILNSEIISGGTSKNIAIPLNGANKLIILISFSEEWTASISTLTSGQAIGGPAHIYPDSFSVVQSPKQLPNYPHEMIVGYGIHKAKDELEAFVKSLPPRNTINLILRNESDVDGVANIRALRMWEG